MADGDNGRGRVRAWVLLKVEDPPKVARDLYRPPNKDVDEIWFMVRVDVVDGDYDIVVPVDAQDQTALDAAYLHIKSVAGVQPPNSTILQVNVHNPGNPDYPNDPYPAPHGAQGYVTLEEFNKYKDRCVKEGLQILSPGANAWG